MALFASGALFSFAWAAARRCGNAFRAWAAITAWAAMLCMVALGAADSAAGLVTIALACIALTLIATLPAARRGSRA